MGPAGCHHYPLPNHRQAPGSPPSSAVKEEMLRHKITNQDWGYRNEQVNFVPCSASQKSLDWRNLATLTILNTLCIKVTGYMYTISFRIATFPSSSTSVYTTLCPLFVLITPSTRKPIGARVRGHHCSREVHPPGTTPLKKALSPSSHQLSASSQPQVGASVPSPIRAGM